MVLQEPVKPLGVCDDVRSEPVRGQDLGYLRWRRWLEPFLEEFARYVAARQASVMQFDDTAPKSAPVLNPRNRSEILRLDAEPPYARPDP